jgi:toxin ParE1/3/4
LKAVKVTAPAEAELRAATAWYNDRDPRVAQRFTNETRATIALIEEFPEIGGIVPDIADSDVRRMPVRGFPYHIVFVRLPNRLDVIAFAHNRRRSAYFLRRLRRS